MGDFMVDRTCYVSSKSEGQTGSEQASCTEDRYREIQCQVKLGDVKEQYQVTTINTFAVLENLQDSGYINRAGDNVRENIKISAQEELGYCESKQSKTWFDEECSKLVD
jgi:hypothetical protein